MAAFQLRDFEIPLSNYLRLVRGSPRYPRDKACKGRGRGSDSLENGAPGAIPTRDLPLGADNRT
jgi:hypothetical protein